MSSSFNPLSFKPFISHWAEAPIDYTPSLERCLRVHFLRQDKSSKPVIEKSFPAAKFTFGRGLKTRTRVSQLRELLAEQGFTCYRRLGEGSEAFVVRAKTIAGEEKAIRISKNKAHVQPSPFRLPCDAVFALTEPRRKHPSYWITIAPVADTKSVRRLDVFSMIKEMFVAGVGSDDLWLDNIGRYNSRLVLIDYGARLKAPVSQHALARLIPYTIEGLTRDRPDLLSATPTQDLALTVRPFLSKKERAHLDSLFS